MVEAAISRPLSAADYLNLPESNLPAEFIDGELVMSPAPSLDHQDATGDVYSLLKRCQKIIGGKVYIAPVDVWLDENHIVQPDVLWLAPESRCLPVEGRYLQGPPDLVVEVLSPSSAYRDRSEKFALYERSGVREYWMLDTMGRYLEVWQRLDEKFVRLGVFGRGDSFTSPLLGQNIPLAELFGE